MTKEIKGKAEAWWRRFGHREMDQSLCSISADRYKCQYILLWRLVLHPRSTMSQFPATVKAVTFSKTGDVDVIEETAKPFPKQGPRDVILKVRATTTQPPCK